MTRTAAALAAVSLALLAGCSDADSGDNDLDEGLSVTEEVAVDPAAGDAPMDGDVSELRVPADDIKLVCAKGYQRSHVEVRNSAPMPRHFHITVYFSDADGVRIDRDFIHPWDLQPGESARSYVSSDSDWVSCRVGRALAIPADTAPSGDIWWPLA